MYPLYKNSRFKKDNGLLCINLFYYKFVYWKHSISLIFRELLFFKFNIIHYIVPNIQLNI